MTTDEIAVIESFLDSILLNKPVEPMDDPGDLQVIQDKFIRLSNLLQELKRYAVRLSSGDVNAPTPSRENFIAAGLKQLQAQMLHLTWQAQRIAQGDYRQQIDFMGEFSMAFNEMVDQLRNREASLREQQDAMEKIFNMVEPIFVLSESTTNDVLYVNEMATHRFALRVGINDKIPTVLQNVTALTPGNIEHQVHDPDTDKWYGITVRTLHWSNQRRARLFYCRDITMHKERENDLDIVANTDELTGINNRRAFDQSFLRLWNQCENAHKPLSVIMFDLDHFKNFNDTFGHMEGDKILTEFANILKRCITRKDDLIARYGGEEFIVALPFTVQDQAMRIAHSVCEMTAKRVIIVRGPDGNNQQTGVTVSGGVSSIIPTEELRPPMLVLAADQALYQAKLGGRNSVCYQFVEK